MLNGLDVCDRALPPSSPANARPEGSQLLGSGRALAAMPSEGALLVFSSDPVPSGLREIRGARLSQEGNYVESCERQGDIVWSEQASGVTGRGAAALGAPRSKEHPALVAWAEEHSPSDGEIVGRMISPSGCPSSKTFSVSGEQPGYRPYTVSIASLSDDLWVVAWASLNVFDARIYLRVFESGTSIEPEALPTVLAPDASPAPWKRGLPPRIEATPTGSNQFALSWLETDTLTWSVRTAWLDDRLDEYASTTLVARGPRDATVSNNSPVGLTAAWNGSRLLVTWAEQETAQGVRLKARVVSPTAADKGPFPIVTLGDTTAEGKPSATSGAGRFFVSWEVPVKGGTTIEAVILDDQGQVEFANAACGASTFPISDGQLGSQTRPSIAWLPGGTLLSAWTELESEGADISGAGVRARGLTQRQILAIE